MRISDWSSDVCSSDLVEGGQFAIVDGQHRTTAAMLRKQPTVPCQIVQADRAKQAAAYAAVNGNVTRTTPTQLFHARMAAGDEQTKAVAAVCQAAQVTIEIGRAHV